MSEVFNIGLGNNNSEIRKQSEPDYAGFWAVQAKKLAWFSTWIRLWIGILPLQNGLRGA